MTTKIRPLPDKRTYHSTSSTTLSALTFSRTWLAAVAKENMEIVDNGYYINNQGVEVDISKALKGAVANSKHYHYSNQLSPPTDSEKNVYETKMYVCYSLIIKAALALKKAGAKHVGVLNSADGFRPGGKFGTGCHSLEACICRGSLLRPCLDKFDKDGNMYKVNNKDFPESPSSCGIFSPDVPVIRKDALEATFLDEIELCSFVSLPPPNAFALGSEDIVRREMKKHISRALYIFAENGCTDLVLCTYGCGTRGHDPVTVAEIYKELLTTEMKGVFKKIVFAINPKKKEEYRAFATKFEENSNI